MPCTKLKSKWVKNLNIRLTTLNLTEEKVGSTLEHIGMEDHFLNITLVTQTLRETINKWDLLKLRSFCKGKDTVNKSKWKRLGKDLHQPNIRQRADLKIYKELKKLVMKRTNNPIKMGCRSKQRILNRGISNGQKHLSNFSTSLALR